MLSLSRIVLAVGLLASFAGCNTPPKDVTQLSEERRIWIVRRSMGNDTTVYRCADGAGPDQPPKPVCIRAPLVDQP
jgi:hypothetical protein